MHVEPLRVVAFGPGHDVGGPQQGGIGDAGDRAAASPIIHQGGAEDVLADALDDESLGLGRLRQAGGPRAKPGERGVGEADAELVDAVERGMQRGQSVEGEGGEAGSGQGRGRQRCKLSRDAGMDRSRAARDRAAASSRRNAGAWTRTRSTAWCAKWCACCRARARPGLLGALDARHFHHHGTGERLVGWLQARTAPGAAKEASPPTCLCDVRHPELLPQRNKDP